MCRVDLGATLDYGVYPRGRVAHGLLFQATLEELAEFPDEEIGRRCCGRKGEFPPWLKRQLFQRCLFWGATAVVGFQLRGLVLFFKPDSCIPALNNELSYQ